MRTTKTSNTTLRAGEKGNAALAVVVIILVIAAIGAGVYFSGQITMDQDAQAEQTAATQTQDQEQADEVAALETQNGENTEEQASEESTENGEKPMTIEPGNPVVAKLNGEEIKRTDLLRFIQQMGPQIQGQNLKDIYPQAQEQLINNQIITQKVDDVDLSKNEKVQEHMEEARKNIERAVFIQQKLNERMTEERIRKEYEKYTKDLPEVTEMNAAHILVDDKKTADEVIAKLENGADFAELAQEYSKDNTAENGGDLGYFAKEEVVAEFAEAAFKLDEGDVTQEPIKSQFGYHIIKAGEKRERGPVPYEEAKPQIEKQLQPILLNEMLAEWREEAEIEKYDINGQPVEPAAGGDE